MESQRGLVQRIERKLESAVGDAFARVFGGAVVPEELEAALRREAAAGVRSLPGNRLLAANEYVITLGEHDYETVGTDPGRSADAFARHLTAYISEQGWQTYGDVVVRFQQTPSLHTGQVRTRGAVNPDASPGPTVERPRPPESNHAFTAEAGESPMSDNPSYRGGPGQDRPGGDYYDDYSEGRHGRPQNDPRGGPEPRGPYPPEPDPYPQEQRGGYPDQPPAGYPDQPPAGYPDQPPAGYPPPRRPEQGGYPDPGQGGYPDSGQGGYPDPGQGYPDPGQGGYPPPYEQRPPASFGAGASGYDPGYRPAPSGYGPPPGQPGPPGPPGYGQPGYGEYGRPPRQDDYAQPEPQRPPYPEQGGGGYDQGAPPYPRQDYGQPDYGRYPDAPASPGYGDAPGNYDYGQPPAPGGGYEAPGGYGEAQGNYDYGQPAGGYDDYDQRGYAPPAQVTLQLDDGSGRTYQLRDGSNVVGRGQDAQFRLPDTGVSRRHLEIRWDGRVALLSDLNSTNGTTVNNAPVQEWQLADGDVIRLGHSEIIVRVH